MPPDAASASRGGDRQGVVAAVLLALAVAGFWTVFLVQAERSVFCRVPILDEVYYLDRAADWSAGRAGDEAFFMSPLYPALIALVGGGDAVRPGQLPDPSALRGLRLLQFGFWSGTFVILRLLAGRVLGPRVPGPRRRLLAVWIPPLLFASYRPAAVFAASVLLDTALAFMIAVFVYLATVMFGSESGRRRSVAMAAAMGLVVGSATLLRGTGLLLLVPAVAAAWWSGAGAGRKAAQVAAILAVTFLVLAPAVVHNSRLSGRLVGPTLNGGVNLNIGNGSQANGFYVAVVAGDPRYDPAGRLFLAERFGRPGVSLAEADALWRDDALLFMRQHPLRTIRLWGKKIWLHLQGWEIDQLTPLSGWVEAAPVLRILVLPYGLLVVLALAAVVDLGRPGPLRWWFAVAAVLLAGQSVFFVVSRYRLALVPLWALAGGWTAASLLGGPPRRAVRYLIPAALAILIVVPWGLGGIRTDWRAMARGNEAMRWYEIGRHEGDAAALERSRRLYREALDGGADIPATWMGMAAVALEEGDQDEAVAILRAGVEALPKDRYVRKSLVTLLLQEDRQVAGLIQCLALLHHHPRDADTLHLTAILLEGMSRREVAMEAAQQLMTWHPADPRGYNDLGIMLARSGRRDEARDVFERGLDAVPGHRELQTNLLKLDE